MEVLNKIKDETIIITNYSYKENLLKKISKDNKLYNISFMSMKELINRYYFSYDYNAIYYLIEKYGFKYDVATLYLKNLIYIEDKVYNNFKLDKLVQIKKELKENNLLIYDKYFKNYLEGKRILFLGFDYFKSLEKKLISSLEKDYDVEKLKKEYKEYNHKVYEFKSLEDEVEYVAISILKLIEKGIDINKIKITNFSDDYFDAIKKIFHFYGLDINYNNEKLISTKIVQDFFLLSGDISKRIEVLKSKYPNNKILEELISVCNKYISFSNLKICLAMIREELKNRTLSYDKASNMIDIIDFKNYPITDDMYIFMIGFNQNSVPVVYNDEDYITDNIKDGVYLDSTKDLNLFEKNSTIKNLLNIKNLCITYKKSSFYETFLPSNLVSDLGLEVEVKTIDLSESYSNINSKVKLNKLIDEYLRTGIVTSNLKMLYSNFSLDHSTYDNSFKGIDKNAFKEYVEGSYNLSYSAMDNFYKCPFRYYASNVLKLDIFEDNFITYLGSLFHCVLEHGLKENLEVDYLTNKFVEENERKLSPSERFFVKNIKNDISFSLEVIKEQLENTSLKNMLFENKISVEKKGDISVTFKGFVDKMMYEEKDGKTILCIIDYKTGHVDTDLRKVLFGLSMQLPVYLYLANNSDFKNISFAGFYIQRVLNNEPSITSKSYEQLKKESLMLSGYSNSDKDTLYEFDHTYKNSKYIKSLRLNNDESFSYYSKVLNDNQIERLINLVEEKIDEAVENINNCNFEISPKTTKDENIGCKYCKFSSICFKENKDLKYVEFPRDLSFLGGDNNA